MKGIQGILCAVKFDDCTRSVVRSAAHLAKRAGVDLTLAHVVEPWDQYGIAHFLSHDTRAKTLVHNADAETYQRAQTLLVQLAEELAPVDIPVRTGIFQGNAGETLIREAGATQSWLVVGAKQSLSAFFPKTMSTTLTLASECPTPVLFVPRGGERLLEHPSIRILASDDLTSDSQQGPVQAACQVAQWYEEAHIWHVHVSSLNEETLNAAIIAAFAETRTPFEPGLAGAELFQLMAEAMQRKLIKRLSDERLCPAHHHSILRFGDIETELMTVRGEHDLDLAVFGRHRPFHMDPFYVGNLPPANMFKLNLPVLITPT